MPLFGKIVVIKRDGADGAQFPLTAGTCIFGRNADCDIRVQLPNVAKEHCRIEVDLDGNIFLVNLCPVYPTLLNKKAVTERIQIQHMDVFTVTDRSFRVEFPPGSPFRKCRPSTDSTSPIQPSGPVKSECKPELSTLTVPDEKPVLSIATSTTPSAAAKGNNSNQTGVIYTPKGETPMAKTRTPSYLVRTPLQKGKGASPMKSQAKSPIGVKRGPHTPLTGQKTTNFRISSARTVTPRSKPPVSSSSLAKSTSALLADEIAKLKLSFTKPKGSSTARTSVLKTPVGTASFHISVVKAKTPVAVIIPRVRSNIVPTPKSNRLISISKTPVVTPAAKTPVSIRSKGLTTKTSSVHRVRKVMTPSPRANAQKRRSASLASSVIGVAKKSPLRNIVPHTLEASNETALFANEKSQGQNLSSAKTLGRPSAGSPKISSSTGPSTRRKSFSPVILSPGSSLRRSKSHSPRWSRAKSSPQKMLQSTEIQTKKRHSFNSSNTGAHEIAKRTPSYNISSQSINLIPSDDDTEVVGPNLEISFRDKSSSGTVSSDGTANSPRLTPVVGDVRRRSRGSKVSSPGEHPASVKSQSPTVEAHTNTRTLSLLTMSPGSSLTRSKSQSPLGGPAKSHSLPRGSVESSAEEILSEDIETPVLHRRSSTRPSNSAKRSLVRGKSHSPLGSSAKSSTVRSSQGVETLALPRRSSSRPRFGAKQSPMHEVLSEASGPKMPQAQVEAVHSIVATSFVDTISGEIFSCTDEKSQSPKLSPDVAQNPRKSRSSLTRTPSSLTRSKPQSPLGSSAELSAQKKLQSSQMSPVDEGKAKVKSQSALESPTVAYRRVSLSPTKSSTQSKLKSPYRSPREPSTDRSFQHSNDSTIDSNDSMLDSLILKKSQNLKVSSPSKNQDNIPAVTDDCFLESYEQQFSPLILEMDDVDEGKESPKKTTPISSSRRKGGSEAESLKSAVVRLHRKSQPLLEELEDGILNTKSAGKEIDTSGEFDQTFEEKSFVSPSQGVKRSGSPLKGRPKKRRCVSFGPDMSPELFDRSLPVATPLKRGATPRRRSSSADQIEVRPKPLLKNRRSMHLAAAAVLQEEPQEAGMGKSPTDLKVMGKLSKRVAQNPVLGSMTTLNAETFAATDLEPSQPVITPPRRQTKPRRASVVEAVIYPKSARKSRRATLATAGVIPEALLEEFTEKSPKSPMVHEKESVVPVNVMDAKVLTSSEIQIPISSVTSPIVVGPQTDSQKRKIFTSGTGTERLSRALKTPSAAEVTTSNENSPAVKTSARKEKTPKVLQNLPPRSSLPLTNMQNSSMLHQKLDPFAFESSPESSPKKLTPKRMDQGKNAEVNTAASGDLSAILALESGKKKLLSKSQEDVTTPKVALDFTVAGSATSLLKSSRSVERISAKYVHLAQEHKLPETPTTIIIEGLRSTGRRSSYTMSTNEVVYETPAETTPNVPRSTGRRSSRLADNDQEEHITELTPVMNKSSGRRSTSTSKLSSANTGGKAVSEQVLKEKRGTTSDSATKTPGSTGKRRYAKSEERFKTPNAKVIDRSSGGGLAMSAGDGISAPSRFSNRKSSSPFKRPFGSEPRKLRVGQIGELFRQSPEEARKATTHARNKAGQMVSERNIDLSSLSPLKFYKSPAVEALTGKRSKVTPGRAVALRAVYGKMAVPPLAELQMSRRAAETKNAGEAELVDETTKSMADEKSHSSRVAKRKNSTIQAVTKKRLEKKMGFAVKKKQTKALLLKRVGRRSVGQVVKRFLPARKRNPLTISGQKSLPNITESDVLELLSEKDQAVAELSKSASSYSILSTPNGPGEMSVSPWSSPVGVLSGKRRSGDRKAAVGDTSKGQNSPSFGGLKGILASSREGGSPTLSGRKLSVETSQTEPSHQVLGVKQLAKSSKIEKSPQLSGVRKLLKTPKAQKSPQLTGVKNLVKTPKLQKSPKLGGVRLLVKTPKVQISPQLNGVKQLMKTPKVQKSPQFIGVRNLVRTPKVQKSPKLSGVRDLVLTPKDQISPKLIGIRNLVRTPKMRMSPKLSGVKILVKTPKGGKSPRLHGVKKLVKTPKVQKSPQLSGVRNLMRTPKFQESPDLTGVKSLVKSTRQMRTRQLDKSNDLVSTPQLLSSPELSRLNKLVLSPATQSPLQVSGFHKMVKTPKTQESGKREGIQKLVQIRKPGRSPKIRPTPKQQIVHIPMEILSPEFEGVRELYQTPFMQQSAKKTRVKSPVKSPETNEPSQSEADLSSPRASAVKQIAQKVKSTDKLLKSSVATELKETQEFAPLEDVTPVRPVRRLSKPTSLTDVEKVKDILQLSMVNVLNDENVGKDNKTVAAKTRMRKIAESDEKPPAKKRHVDLETEDNARNDGKDLHSAVKKGRGTKKIAAETLTRPLEIEVNAFASNAVGHLHKGKGKGEKSSAMHDAPSPKLIGSRNSRSQRAKTLPVEQMALKDNVTVEEHVKLDAKRQDRSSKKDLLEELAAKGEDEVKSKTRGKGKAAQVEMEVFVEETATENVEALIPTTGKKSNGRRQGRAKNDVLREVVPAEAVQSEATETNTRARGKGKATQVETEVFVEETATENVEALIPTTAEKSTGRRQGRAKKNELKEVVPEAVQSKAESKARARGKDNAIQAQTEVFVEETATEHVEALIPTTTEKSNGRQQGRARKNELQEVVQAKVVESNAAESKTRARGKTITTKLEAVSPEQVTLEENVESSVAVKIGNRRVGRTKGEANEELNVQSKAVVAAPERRSRAQTQGKARLTEVEVKVNVDASSVQETAKLGSRQQVRTLKKDISEEADIQTESIVNKTGRKIGGRGKSKTQLAETMEEIKEKTVGPSVRDKKLKAKEDVVESSAVNDNADETVEIKRPVKGRKTKSGGEKAQGKGLAIASDEAVAVEDETTGMLLNKKTESAVVASGKRGRKGATVEPVSSDAEVIARVVQSSRKRNAKTVEEIAPTKSKKARLDVEAIALESAKEVLSPKPLKRGSRKTGVANNKDGNNLANEKLDTADYEPTETSAGRRHKKKAEIAPVSATTAEAIKTNALEKKRGKIASNKAKSTESSNVPMSRNAVTSQKQKTIEASSEVDQSVGLQRKGRSRKVKFDVPPTPVVDALEKAAQKAARGRSGASKKGSEKETAGEELHATIPKARVSRDVSRRKDTAPPPPPAKRAMRAARK